MTPRCGWADAVSAAALVLCQTWSIAGILLVPAWIGTQPLLLELVHGSAVSVVSAAAFSHTAGTSPMLPIVTSVPLWAVVDTMAWWAGRRHGRLITTTMLSRGRKSADLAAWCEQFLERHGIVAVLCGPLLPVPTALVFAGCGWRRMALPLFVSVDVLGVVTRNAAFVSVGYLAHGSTVYLADLASRTSVLLTAVVLVLIILRLLLVRPWRR